MVRSSFLLTAVLVFAAATESYGQSRSLFGSSGPTGGQSSLGSSSSLGGSSRSTSSLGGTSLSSGLSGNANSPLGSAGSSLGSNQQTSLDIGGANIQLSGQSGFVGRSDNAGRFVGNAQTSQQTTDGRGGQSNFGQSNFGQGGGQFSLGGNQGGLNALLNGQMGNQFGPQGTGGAKKGVLRPQQKVAFTVPTRTAVQASTDLNVRFKTLENRSELHGVTVAPKASGDVILRGQVPTDDARKLAAALVRLEPGVRSVQNEITVKP